MKRDDIRAVVFRSLRRVAPEADPGALDVTASLREELDLDSMDVLTFVTALHEELHVDIPEVDYPKVDSIEGCVTYLDAALRAL